MRLPLHSTEVCIAQCKRNKCSLACIFIFAIAIMAIPEKMADVEMTGCIKRPALDIQSLQRKKFKTSELPLTAAQHAAIDSLLYACKKKGIFDNVRKMIWAEFNESV
jgi:hypothetical protein